jgi:cellulose synthase/poly-beta-1,6-N-acetylglucosamine synthase-like glycosyltransferase
MTELKDETVRSPAAAPASDDSQRITVSVVIAAYTMDRWELISRSIQSLAEQTVLPDQVILCIDHNDELLERARLEWGDLSGPSQFPVQVIADEDVEHLDGRDEHFRVHGSSRRFGAGSVRTTGVRHCRSDIVAFLDDDAEATSDWLEHLLQPYQDEAVVAVGGAPLPRYETERPSWFPEEFDWVFGCAYAGMPTALAPIRHMIGANMSARREALLAVGGFHSVDFDDMDISHRLADAYPESVIIYNPEAVVLHYVSHDRVTWHYFWRRCFHVNRHKVRAFVDMGAAANLKSERDFVVRILARQLLKHLRDFVSGDTTGATQFAVSVTGVSLAGLGNLVGRIEMRLHR